MKNLKTVAIAFVAVLSSFATTAQTKKINTSASTIEWVGKKVTGQHSGTMKFKDGALTFKGGKLTGGSFTVDMTSVNVTDLEGEYKGKLEGHLKAEDFFGTDKYKTSTLVFKSVKEKSAGIYAVTADLTIKNITKPVTFDLTVGKDFATTNFNIDRTKYGIEYNSGSIFDGLGDKVIYDEFELAVTLKF
ncbi:YceI family protein [Flavobacterium rhizosphaerae]|uniref:YceI family protein n=1 Tax=Flavobacterium rhizosphaerae TaxID=3163298 RepID=A0ABW8YUT5_9FLAO